jgi:hypothetical protein
MASQKAHWYNVIAPLDSDPSRHEIDQVFLLLSSLLNIEVQIMNKVLKASGLCQKKGIHILQKQQAWREFIAEFQIDADLTMFSIGNKCCHFLRIGSFNKMNHPSKMPVLYW